MKQPTNFPTRGHFTKQYKYPQNLCKHHHLVNFGTAIKPMSLKATFLEMQKTVRG